MSTTPPDTAPTASATPAAVVWPPSRFVWAVIDGHGWTKTGPLPPGFLPAFQDLCPTPLDDHHAVCVPVPRDRSGTGGTGGAGGTPARLLACAAPAAALAASPLHVERLTPAAVPAALLPECPADAQTALAGALNLLVGAHEPTPVRARRLKRHTLLAGGLVAGALVLTLGLARRVWHWRAVESEARAALVATGRAVDPSLATGLADPDALATSLRDHARTLASVARTLDATPVPRDAGAPLAGLLACWPLRPEARLLSISATGERASLSISVQGDPAPLLKSLSAPAGWSMAEPRLSTAGSVARLSIALVREPGTPLVRSTP